MRAHQWGVSKAKKPAVKSKEIKTPGTRAVQKYRPKMNKLSDAERQKLLAHAMETIYGPAGKY